MNQTWPLPLGAPDLRVVPAPDPHACPPRTMPRGLWAPRPEKAFAEKVVREQVWRDELEFRGLGVGWDGHPKQRTQHEPAEHPQCTQPQGVQDTHSDRHHFLSAH